MFESHILHNSNLSLFASVSIGSLYYYYYYCQLIITFDRSEKKVAISLPGNGSLEWHALLSEASLFEGWLLVSRKSAPSPKFAGKFPLLFYTNSTVDLGEFGQICPPTMRLWILKFLSVLRRLTSPRLPGQRTYVFTH
jgi:hypothetical protein